MGKKNDFNEPVFSEVNWPVPQIDPNRCDGCGKCVIVCPNHVLKVENQLAFLVSPERCNYTGLCEKVCPTRAISLFFEIIGPGEVSGE